MIGVYHHALPSRPLPSLQFKPVTPCGILAELDVQNAACNEAPGRHISMTPYEVCSTPSLPLTTGRAMAAPINAAPTHATPFGPSSHIIELGMDPAMLRSHLDVY